MTTQYLMELATKHHENVQYGILCDAKDNMRDYRYWSYQIKEKMELDLDIQLKRHKEILEVMSDEKKTIAERLSLLNNFYKPYKFTQRSSSTTIQERDTQ